MDLAPYVYWNCSQPEDIKEQQETASKATEAYGKAFQAVGTAVEKLDAGGVDYDLDYMIEQMGIKLKRPV